MYGFCHRQHDQRWKTSTEQLGCNFAPLTLCHTSCIRTFYTVLKQTKWFASMGLVNAGDRFKCIVFKLLTAQNEKKNDTGHFSTSQNKSIFKWWCLSLNKNGRAILWQLSKTTYLRHVRTAVSDSPTHLHSRDARAWCLCHKVVTTLNLDKQFFLLPTVCAVLTICSLFQVIIS